MDTSDKRYWLDDDTMNFVKERALAQKPSPVGNTRAAENDSYVWSRRVLDLIYMIETMRKENTNVK